MRAMSLAADEAEGEQNEMRTLQLQLENTQKLLSTLSLQLSDMKDQVWVLNYLVVITIKNYFITVKMLYEIKKILYIFNYSLKI